MDEAEVREERRKFSLEIKRSRAMEALVASEGWKFLVELINLKIEEKMTGVFDRPKGGDERGEAWDKGACYAYIHTRDLPDTIIAATKQLTPSDPAAEETSE